MVKNLFNKWFNDIFVISSFESFKLGTYEVHYLIDCGAGYMGGNSGPITALSINDAVSGFKKHDIEKIYCDGNLVYKASWSDDDGIVVNKVGI